MVPACEPCPRSKATGRPASVIMEKKKLESLNSFKELPDLCANRTDPPADSDQWARMMRELRGKFRGKGLMQELMAEKKREKEPT